jgi:hypothetical protein
LGNGLRKKGVANWAIRQQVNWPAEHTLQLGCQAKVALRNARLLWVSEAHDEIEVAVLIIEFARSG